MLAYGRMTPQTGGQIQTQSGNYIHNKKDEISEFQRYKDTGCRKSKSYLNCKFDECLSVTKDKRKNTINPMR
jgi:hypothetical protein